MARVKYYDQASQEWKYADAALNMKGKDGYTPQKGIDYFTEEDVRELTENVLDQGVLTYNEQELTEDQKAQARENIGIDQISFDKLTENLDADGFRITNLPLPQSGSEPATKEFVENFTIEGSTYVATDDGEGNVTIRPYLADEDELVFKSHIQNQNNPHGVTAAQVGARPNNWMPTAAEVGAATSEELQEAVKKAAPRNLLDNSDFTNPVNQRGQKSYTATGYTIDRWRTYSEDETVEIQNGYISKTGNLLQYVSGLDPDKTYTVAVCLADGTIAIEASVLSASIGGWGSMFYVVYDSSDGLSAFRLTSNAVDVKWVALYEGEYTIDTLPEYQPKGYAVEFAECSRYYHHIGNARMTGCVVNGLGLVVPITVPTKMRQDIIASAVTVGPAQIFNDNGVWDNVSFYIVDYDGGGTYRLFANQPVNTTTGHAYLVMGIDALSADL